MNLRILKLVYGSSNLAKKETNRLTPKGKTNIYFAKVNELLGTKKNNFFQTFYITVSI